MLQILYLHPSIKLEIYTMTVDIHKLEIYTMTVDIHVSWSFNLILNSSRSTEVNTKYQQQQTDNLNSLAFVNSQ